MYALDLIFDGGWVMWPLVAAAFALWFCLGFRLIFFLMLNKNDFFNSDSTFFKKNKDTYITLIKSLLVISPLLGLLGTVSGMIETFDSLADMRMYSQSGGIASGISKALFTTQLGLVISAPGLLFFKFIERKINKLTF